MRFSKLQFDNTDIEHVKQTTILRDFAWSCQNASDYVSQFSSNMIMWTGRVCLCFSNIIILFIDKVVCCLCSNKRDCQMSRTTITRLLIKVGGRYVVYDTAPIGTTNFAHNVSAISFLHSLPTVPRLWFFFYEKHRFHFFARLAYVCNNIVCCQWPALNYLHNYFKCLLAHTLTPYWLFNFVIDTLDRAPRCRSNCLTDF